MYHRCDLNNFLFVLQTFTIISVNSWKSLQIDIEIELLDFFF